MQESAGGHGNDVELPLKGGAMGKLIYTTAIVVIPAENVWPGVQAIRTKHDAKVRRWMPHITLVYSLPSASVTRNESVILSSSRDMTSLPV
jgi:hypothetical protein